MGGGATAPGPAAGRCEDGTAAGRALLAAARAAGRRALTEPEAKRLVAGFGVAVPRGIVAPAPGAIPARVEAAGLSGPFAVKAISPSLAHKSDAGAVALGAADAAAAARAAERMAALDAVRAAAPDGFLVEEMAPPGVELVVGALRDPRFGPVVMVGVGGVLVELLGDVAFRLCPIEAADARSMLDELRGAALLDGFRGGPAVDREAVVSLLLAVGGERGLLARLGDELAELDLNPVVATRDGLVAVDARVVLGVPGEAAPALPPAPGADRPVLERFAPLLEPRTVAVVGASATSTTIANTFIRRLRAFGYPGRIFPIHPRAGEIEGLPCHPSLAETPAPVDYAYVAIAAERIPDLLAAAAGNVRIAQVISSGFGEVAGGGALERELVARARAAGCRVVGPNCLGTYSPRGGLTFSVDAPRETGTVGVICQSGGLGTDVVKRGQWRGLRFSAVVTAGNCADVEPAEWLELLLADPCTGVIGFYLEDVKDGRRFLEVLRGAPRPKPVVVLRGGRSAPGRAAAASHTGALAADDRVWRALAAQAPCALVDTLDELLDVLLALSLLEPRPTRPTRRVALFGNGGGTSVLCADLFADRGLAVEPFDPATRARLEAMRLPPGTSVANPVDAPVRTLQERDGAVAREILETIYARGAPDAVVMHLNLAAFVGRGDADPIDNLIEAALDVGRAHPGRAHLLLALRSDGSPELDDRRRRCRARALAAGIPAFDELTNVAAALHALAHLEHHAR